MQPSSANPTQVRTIGIKILSILLSGWSIFLVGWFILQRAWMGDDAYITLRTAANLVRGYGPVFNIGERVQGYTHPLWMLILAGAYGLTHETYLTTILISLIFTLITLLILHKKIALQPVNAILITLLLGLSSAFLDFSTGGLENPLSHCLLVIFAAVYFSSNTRPGRYFWLSFLAALASITRPDTVLIYWPILLFEFLQEKTWVNLKWLLIGQTPLICWEIFSLVYYGFFVPNTYFSKTNIVISRLDLWRKGLDYFLHTWKYDPYTIGYLAVGSILEVFYPAQPRNRAWMVGFFLYLLYILYIGADYMGGRFFTLLMMILAVLFCRRPIQGIKWKLWVYILLAGCFIAGRANSTPWNGGYFAREELIDENGVADERQYYYEKSALFSRYSVSKLPMMEWRQEGEALARGDQKVFIQRMSGIRAFFGGPEIDFIDNYGLTDPFISHLPYIPTIDWRIGHFDRIVPEEYKLLRMGYSARFADPELQSLYERITLISRAPIWSAERWQAILEMNQPFQ